MDIMDGFLATMLLNSQQVLIHAASRWLYHYVSCSSDHNHVVLMFTLCTILRSTNIYLFTYSTCIFSLVQLYISVLYLHICTSLLCSVVFVEEAEASRKELASNKGDSVQLYYNLVRQQTLFYLYCVTNVCATYCNTKRNWLADLN